MIISSQIARLPQFPPVLIYFVRIHLVPYRKILVLISVIIFIGILYPAALSVCYSHLEKKKKNKTKTNK